MNKQKTVIAAAAFVIIATLTSCDFSGLTDAIDDFSVLIGLEPINTSATVLITDAKTGELVESNVNVTFDGTNGSDVIDIYSDPLPEDDIDDGILNFGIDNSVSPSESSPATITLNLESDGYLAVSRTISIDEVGSSSFSIRMIKENNKPAGVNTSTSSEGATDEQGAVQEDFTVTAASETNEGLGASVEVKKGTVFKDSEGNTLSGQLTTEVSYFDPTEKEAMASIPVDLEVEGGEKIVLAGASSIKLKDSNGRVAKNVESTEEDGVSLALNIPTDMYNPVEGRNYMEGDSITIFIQGESSAKSKNGKAPGNWIWFYVPIIEDPISTFEFYSIEVSELNWPELNFSIFDQNIYMGSLIGSCTTILTLNRNGQTGPVEVSANAVGFNYTGTIKAGESSLTLVPPSNLNVDYTLTTSSGQEVSGTFTTCGSVSETLPAPPSNLIDATINVSLSCQNPNEKITVTTIPTASIRYNRAGAPAGQSKEATNISWTQDAKGRITGGSFDVSGVLQGEDYDFTIKIDTETRKKTLEITGPQVDYEETVDSGICSS